MKEKPYIGITGFKIKAEIEGTAEIFDVYLQKDNYTAMFGFLVSNKRLTDFNAKGEKSPAIKDLNELTSLVPKKYLPMMHYYTTNKNNLANEVAILFNHNNMYWDNNCSALQINMDWPEINQIEKIKSTFPEMKIVMQIPNKAMKNKTINEMVDLSKNYSGLVEYILVDPSGGIGQDFNIEQCVEIMSSINNVLLDSVIGIAGGLSGDNVYEKITSVKDHITEPFSFDAQGKLRVEVFGESFLCPNKVKTYIENGCKAINR